MHFVVMLETRQWSNTFLILLNLHNCHPGKTYFVLQNNFQYANVQLFVSSFDVWRLVFRYSIYNPVKQGFISSYQPQNIIAFNSAPFFPGDVQNVVLFPGARFVESRHAENKKI